MKIVIIGAGSGKFGRGQIADVLMAEELKGKKVTLSLVDENAEALELMGRLAERMKKHLGSQVELEFATDRTVALKGATYVITAVARKRWQLWEQDFRVPLSHGFRHVLGENGGPGAMFHTLRSFDTILPICHDIEKICPDALLLNFTNPEARVLNAICHLTKVRAVGLCHGILEALDRLVEYFKKPIEELDVVSAGMNHFYCLLQVKDRATGKDLLPQAVEMARNDHSPKSSTLFRKFAEIFGLFTMPSEDHFGEYLSFGSEFRGVQWRYGQERKKVVQQEKPGKDIVRDYADGKLPPDYWEIVARTREYAVPFICDIEFNRGIVRPAINVLNTEGYIDNLPRDIVVEVPGKADAKGIHPIHVGRIPETIAAYMRTQFSIHTLLTEAYRTRSRKLLLQALLLDPVVNSLTEAEKMLDEMLALQSEFLPKFE